MSVKRRHGSTYALEMEVMPVPGRGASPYWVAILRDVSERQRHLAALEHQARTRRVDRAAQRAAHHVRVEQAIRTAEPGWRIVRGLTDRPRPFSRTSTTPTATQRATPRSPRSARACGARSARSTRRGGPRIVVLLPAASRAEDVGRTAEKVLETLEAPFAARGAFVRDLGVDRNRAVSRTRRGCRTAARRRRGDVHGRKRSSWGYSVYSPGEDAFQRRHRAPA